MEKENKNTTQQLLKPKNDIVFQSLFTKNNAKITKAFVEALNRSSKSNANSNSRLQSRYNKRNRRIRNSVETARNETSTISIDRQGGNSYTRVRESKKSILKIQRW